MIETPVKWVPPRKIRPIAIGIFRHDGKIFVMEGRDHSRGETYYRPIGGGIEFGERGEDALRRELREEIGAELGRVRFLAALENLYELEGSPGHEIVMVYAAEFGDRSFYETEVREIIEDGVPVNRALWVPVADFAAGRARLVPPAVLNLVTAMES
jgi:8-oxo-dGTP pyrophosphatase MutT (NUDIX family)